MSDLMAAWERRLFPLSQEPVVRLVSQLLEPVVRALESRIRALELELLILRCRSFVECRRAETGGKSRTPDE